MTPIINMNYSKRPSMFGTIILALAGRSSVFNAAETLPRIAASRNGISIYKKHLSAFNNMCDIKESGYLPLIYPFSLTYPLLQRILSHRRAPLSLFQTLNTRIRVKQHRRIAAAESLNVFCEMTGFRIREKGLETEIKSVVSSGSEIVWENIQTYYYRGSFGEPDKNHVNPQYAPISDSAAIEEWYLPDGVGMRFAKISGDGNPIHYIKWYAKMFGFRHDFAQPLLVLGNAVERLAVLKVQDKNHELELDVSLKGQAYYGNTIILKSENAGNAKRFDLFCEGDPRPIMTGILGHLHKT